MLIESLDDGDDTHAEPVEGKGAVDSQKVAVRLFVGAGARLLFYPTLLYNVIRNKFEPDFRWWDEIEQFLLLGAVPFPKDVFRLKDLGVEAVITLNESFETLVSASLYESQMIKHLVIPTQDYLFAPSFENIERAVDFIHENTQQGKTTYVHCKAGRGRSTTIVLCYLVKYRGMTPSDAFQHVRSKRPRVMLAASQWKAVLMYSEYHYLKNSARSSIFAAPLCWPLFKSLPAGDECKMQRYSDNEISCCGDLPVFVNPSDLEGYKEAPDADFIGSELSNDAGVAYKVRLMAAKSVVSVAKASAALSRLSCVWLGCQAGSQAFNLTLTCSSLPDVNTQLSASDFQSVVHHQPIVSLHVCQQGLVEC